MLSACHELGMLVPERKRKEVFPLVSRPLLATSQTTLAYHEAGHAVISLVLGLPCHEARIYQYSGLFLPFNLPVAPFVTPEGSADLLMLGAKVKARSPAGDGIDLAECVVSMLLAGAQSEFIQAGIDPAGMVHFDDLDHSMARALLCEYPFLPTMGYCQLFARELLLANWARVVEIASELLGKGVWVNDLS